MIFIQYTAMLTLSLPGVSPLTKKSSGIRQSKMYKYQWHLQEWKG